MDDKCIGYDQISGRYKEGRKDKWVRKETTDGLGRKETINGLEIQGKARKTRFGPWRWHSIWTRIVLLGHSENTRFVLQQQRVRSRKRY